MGYRNSTYPLAICGCIDTASRSLCGLAYGCQTTLVPRVIGRWYLEYLYENHGFLAKNGLGHWDKNTGNYACFHETKMKSNQNL